MIVDPSKITPVEKKRRFQNINYEIESEEGEKRRITTQLFGEWTNKELFQSIVSRN